MLIPVLEPLMGPDSYPLSATLQALSTKELRDAGATDLNDPYGLGTTGFAAGMIGKLTAESGSTVLDLADATEGLIIFASNFTDSLRSGKCDFYMLSHGGKYKVKGCYDTGQVYAVNTLLTWIATGANQGKLTPAANYGNRQIIAKVMEAPSSASSDDFMVITTVWQPEAV